MTVCPRVRPRVLPDCESFILYQDDRINSSVLWNLLVQHKKRALETNIGSEKTDGVKPVSRFYVVSHDPVLLIIEQSMARRDVWFGLKPRIEAPSNKHCEREDSDHLTPPPSMISNTFKKRTTVTEHNDDRKHQRTPTATRVFDIDYGLINSYDANTLKSYICMAATVPCIPISVNLCLATYYQLPIGMGLYSSMQAQEITLNGLLCAATHAISSYEYCCELPNQLEKNLETSVSITNDGVEIVTGKHKTGCRCRCLDEGRTVTIIPFDHIREIEIEEPAGRDGFCWLVKNTVSIVTITSSNARNSGVEIRGLTDPYEFKRLVLAMKRQSAGIPVFAQALGNDCPSLTMVREV